MAIIVSRASVYLEVVYFTRFYTRKSEAQRGELTCQGYTASGRDRTKTWDLLVLVFVFFLDFSSCESCCNSVRSNE